MVLPRKRRIDGAADSTVGAPKASHVRELLITLKMRLEAQFYGNGATEHGRAAASNGMADGPLTTDMSATAADLHYTVVERAVQGNIARQLEQVNETLARIDDGKYGICADCVKPIAADRLVARPFAFLCIDCQNQFDRGKLSRF
jgi:DnaK suppressor protein